MGDADLTERLDVKRTRPRFGGDGHTVHNLSMRLDHLSFAASRRPRRDGSASAVRSARLRRRRRPPAIRDPQHGAAAVGPHLLEVVDVLDHPAADKVPFGQAVKARAADGGGWLGWVVEVDDLTFPFEERLGREAVGGSATAPTASTCAGARSACSTRSPTRSCRSSSSGRARAVHAPERGRADGDYSLAALEIAGDPQRVSEWLGETVEAPLEDVKVDWSAPHGTPGILAVQVQTPRGLVRI